MRYWESVVDSANAQEQRAVDVRFVPDEALDRRAAMDKNTGLPSFQEASLLGVLTRLMDARSREIRGADSSVDVRKLTNCVATDCDLLYQTVKRGVEGGGVNARFILTLIDCYELRDQPTLLRDLLLGFLLSQFPEEVARSLASTAGLIRNSGSPA